MLWTVCIILMVIWLLGLVTSYTMGGYIHLFLILAVAAMLIQLLENRHAY